MDHELKQRLIGAVVVTALCAIFIPMLFDDPVDNSGQVVSELSIPAPAGSNAATAGKLPSSAEQVSKLPEPEPLSTDDSPESTGAAEEIIGEPEADLPKQGRSGESLYAESEGYSREDANPEEVVEQPVDNNRSKARPKQPPAEQPLEDAAATRKSLVPKTQALHADAAANEPLKAKKTLETAKPTVAIDKEMMHPIIKKSDKPAPAGLAEGGRAGVVQPENEPSASKQPSTAKSLAAAIAEAKKPAVAAKEAPKMVRWYIQIGSFSKRENAMSLWDSLREQGLPASLDTVQTDKGTSYRLRVGPELDGKKAAAMKARLDKQNIKAILVSE